MSSAQPCREPVPSRGQGAVERGWGTSPPILYCLWTPPQCNLFPSAQIPPLPPDPYGPWRPLSPPLPAVPTAAPGPPLHLIARCMAPPRRTDSWDPLSPMVSCAPPTLCPPPMSSPSLSPTFCAPSTFQPPGADCPDPSLLYPPAPQCKDTPLSPKSCRAPCNFQKPLAPP